MATVLNTTTRWSYVLQDLLKDGQINRNEAERKEELSGKAGVNHDHKPLAVWCCLSQPCSASLADNTAHHTPGHCSDTERWSGFLQAVTLHHAFPHNTYCLTLVPWSHFPSPKTSVFIGTSAMEIPLTAYILDFSSLPVFPWDLGQYGFLLHTHGFVFAIFSCIIFPNCISMEQLFVFKTHLHK